MIWPFKRQARCTTCHRVLSRCICRPCTCGGSVAQAQATQVQPQPMRIEHLVHLVPPYESEAQPVAPERPAAPKEAPMDDWREFDNSWMEETWNS